MQRLKRKNRTVEDLELNKGTSIFACFDNAIKTVYRLNDEEYDHIAEIANDNQLGAIVKDPLMNFTDKRNALRALNDLLDIYEQQKNPDEDLQE